MRFWKVNERLWSHRATLTRFSRSHVQVLYTQDSTSCESLKFGQVPPYNAQSVNLLIPYKFHTGNKWGTTYRALSKPTVYFFTVLGSFTQKLHRHLKSLPKPPRFTSIDAIIPLWPACNNVGQVPVSFWKIHPQSDIDEIPHKIMLRKNLLKKIHLLMRIP